MKIAISGRHMDVTDALKAYIGNGLEKVRSHFDKVIDADVVLSVEKHRHIAEVNLHANGIRIHGKESSPDMYASVDAVLEKLDKQVRKFKDRINRHQPRTAREARDYHHNVIELIESLHDAEVEEQEQEQEQVNHTVVKREKIAMKPMSVDEAAMQLELVDDHFLVFSNSETQQVNVIYARDDGTFGLIEPQF